jgi:hypothetical protein
LKANNSKNNLDISGMSFEESLVSSLNDMFISSSIDYKMHEKINVNIDNKLLQIDLKSFDIKCEPEDEQLVQNVSTVIRQLSALCS